MLVLAKGARIHRSTRWQRAWVREEEYRAQHRHQWQIRPQFSATCCQRDQRNTTTTTHGRNLRVEASKAAQDKVMSTKDGLAFLHQHKMRKESMLAHLEGETEDNKSNVGADRDHSSSEGCFGLRLIWMILRNAPKCADERERKRAKTSRFYRHSGRSELVPPRRN